MMDIVVRLAEIDSLKKTETLENELQRKSIKIKQLTKLNMQLQEGIPALIDASVKKYVQKYLPSKVRPTETSPEQAANQLHPVANSATHAEISCNRDSKKDGLLNPIAQQEARQASDYKKK